MNDNTPVAIENENLPRVLNVSDGALLPVDAQNKLLVQYDERRQNFLHWLFSHLKEGLHFGFPPGCEAVYDESGNLINKKTGAKISPSQWIPKPSLYKSGGQLVIDLLRLSTKYYADMDSWKMAGEPKGTMFRRCELIEPQTGKIIGEGTGAFSVGAKGMDANASIKMADKRAMVASVLNGISVLGELFTQDMEDRLAERRKGNITERRTVLLERVTKLLIDKKSKWPTEAAEWINSAVKSAFGPNAKLSSKGAIDEFEKLLEENKFDINTAQVKE